MNWKAVATFGGKVALHVLRARQSDGTPCGPNSPRAHVPSRQRASRCAFCGGVLCHGCRGFGVCLDATDAPTCPDCRGTGLRPVEAQTPLQAKVSRWLREAGIDT